ncbi:ribosomal protein S18 acetylase RimI-like enzyme [Planomicrobium stackebrandtii]|uniref:Ribosomal protein S18 acetylase RimI-like enzyme n=1 Tax=Planomicrobium stackebrandtii TaxID=253160 RepID=A0ABU0GQ90_9BACL|nr:GNAT family N-acetyltransferase [Planomicrobium stackebrandtii]MDQ0427520.1 ribosomal protein S18 acetylase RimI-like enzyme [Planomicrobium stackebrandtii]
MHIRKALVEDASAIAKVHVDSWRTTYKGIFSNSYLDSLSYEKRTALWENNIGKKDDYVVVAETDSGDIIGFGTASKRDTNTVDRSGDLTSIYLLEEYQGQGIGKMLLKELFLHFKKLGYKRIFVEVLEDNKTRYFYEHYGAKLVNTVQLNWDEKILNELIYEWDDLNDVLEKL